MVRMEGAKVGGRRVGGSNMGGPRLIKKGRWEWEGRIDGRW